MTTITTATDRTTEGYYAVLDTNDSRVMIYTANGVWVGTGTRDGSQIEDCAADLGDEAYEELDAAIWEAVEEREEDSW